MSKSILSAILLVTTLSLSIHVYQYYNRPKYACVNIKEAFEKFDMKKELEASFIESKKVREKILDSLVFDLQTLSSKIESQKGTVQTDVELFEIKREYYIKRKKEIEEDNLKQTEKYDTQIITQLKEYIKVYCDDNSYTMVFGEDNNGSVMFAENENNITDEVIEFINMKYKGI